MNAPRTHATDTPFLSALAAAALLACAAAKGHAQGSFTLNWFTIDGGGGASTGGTFTLLGTIGQPDAGPRMTGGSFAVAGGYWAGGGAAPCYANCDASTTAPVLNVLDFSCFLNKFAAGDPWANCDSSTTPPVLNVLDFSCFLNKFAAGCP